MPVRREFRRARATPQPARPPTDSRRATLPVPPGTGDTGAAGSGAPHSPNSDETKSGSNVSWAESDASAEVDTTLTSAAGAWNGIWNLPEYLSQANQARIAFGNYLGIAFVNPDEAMRTPIGQAIDSLGYNGHQGAMIAGRIANELISGNISPETKNLVEKVREATRTVIDSVADEISKLPAEQAAAVLGEVAGAIQWEMAVGAAVTAASAGVSAHHRHPLCGADVGRRRSLSAP